MPTVIGAGRRERPKASAILVFGVLLPLGVVPLSYLAGAIVALQGSTAGLLVHAADGHTSTVPVLNREAPGQ